jgi:hypothetical protein
MSADRYLKAVLTIIALELGWIALTHGAQPVIAQAAATRVVITGAEVPLDVRTVSPVKIESDRPIKVESVPYTPAQRPGE